MGEQTKAFEFGHFRLEPADCLLLRDGEPVALEPQVFKTLLALVENGGHLSEKGRLMEQVWGDTQVEEGNLTRNISVLRKVLGDGYIQTVPRRGYRFVAPVKQLPGGDVEVLLAERVRTTTLIEEDEEAAEKPELTPTTDTGKGAWVSRPGPRWLAAFAACVLIGAVAVAIQWRWSNGSEPAARPAIKSIAVLPFKPLVPADRNEPLELGIADTLIFRLSGLEEVTVRPLSTVRRCTDLAQDPIAAGRELRADAVVDGSIQKEGEKIRVLVRLIRVDDGSVLWAERCDEKCDSLFAAQDAISARLASQLAPQLTGEKRRLLTKRYTDNPAAYQLYLLGRYFWGKRTQEGVNKAIDYYRQAIALDGSYALAYAGLADAYIALGMFSYTPGAFDRAREMALKALQLDDTLAEPHAALGVILDRIDFDWPGAEAAFRRAIELNPSYATAHQWYAIYFEFVGQPDRALAESRLALMLDPTSLIICTAYGIRLNNARLHDEAIEQFKQALALDPNFRGARLGLGSAYLMRGMYQEALAEYEKLHAQAGADPLLLAAMSRAFTASGNVARAEATRRELAALLRQRQVSPYEMALVQAILRNNDAAFAHLEKALSERDPRVVELRVEPFFDGLRPDPRYADLLRRMNLTP